MAEADADNQPMVEKTDSFATRFEILRDGMSYQALSDALYRKHGKRISPQAMHKWTKGGGIDPASLRLVAEFFGVNEAWLMFGVGNEARGASLENGITDLGHADGQAVLDFFRYKIERADGLMASEKVAHYVSMIERIQADMDAKKKRDKSEE